MLMTRFPFVCRLYPNGVTHMNRCVRSRACTHSGDKRGPKSWVPRVHTHTQKSRSPGITSPLPSQRTDCRWTSLLQWGSTFFCTHSLLFIHQTKMMLNVSQANWRSWRWVKDRRTNKVSSSLPCLGVYSRLSHWGSYRWPEVWPRGIWESGFSLVGPFLPSGPAEALPLPTRAGQTCSNTDLRSCFMCSHWLAIASIELRPYNNQAI